MAGISNLNVGGGLELGTLYTQLETAENTKLTAITKQQTKAQSKVTALGQLQSALAMLQTATAKLKTAETFNATAVTSINTAFSATTGSSAVAGSYDVTVSQIATAQSLISQPIANATNVGDSSATGRVLTLSQGSGDPVSIKLDDGQLSLSGVVKAINASNANVSATTIKGSDGNFRLLITSKETGAANNITLSVSGDSTLQGVIGYDSSSNSGAMSVQTAAQNAKLQVNGIDVENASNVITGAPDGVTLTLKAATTGSEKLEVGKSIDSVKTAITDWVTAYNKVNAVIATTTKYTSVAAGDDQATSNGALVGDSTVRAVQARLSSTITQAQSGGSFAILAQMGITINPDKGADGSLGNLKIDNTRLTKALTDTPQAVTQFFVGDGKTSGLGTQLNTSLTNMMSTAVGKEGVIKNAIDGVNSQLDELGDRYEKMQDRIEATMARYKAQFSNLNSLITKMNSTSSYLTQQFSSSSSSSSGS